MATIGAPGFLARGARPGTAGVIAIAVGLVLGAAALADWLLRGWEFVDGPALLLALALIVLPLQRAHRRALDRRIACILTPWAAERGLVFQPSANNPRTTPTLDKGGVLSAVLVGPIGGDPNGFLAHYTYTVRSGKNSYVVWLTVAIARFEGREGLRLRIGPTTPLAGSGYGVFDDWHGFDTGSVEVDEAYIVETKEGSDPVQVLELLDPVVLVELIDAPLVPLIEIDNGTLLVAYGGRFGIDAGVDDLSWFELLRDEADRWGARIHAI